MPTPEKIKFRGVTYVLAAGNVVSRDLVRSKLSDIDFIAKNLKTYIMMLADGDISDEEYAATVDKILEQLRVHAMAPVRAKGY